MNSKNNASAWLVIAAFAAVYLVWGSTYFFIRVAIHGLPPLLLGAVRFMVSGLLLLGWCALKGQKLWHGRSSLHAAISGLLTLFVSIGLVMWTEQHVGSAVVAIMVSAAPVWFILMDKPHWQQNLSNKLTLIGLAIGFAGVLLLFGEQLLPMLHGGLGQSQLPGMACLLLASIAWTGGSLYSKYRVTSGSGPINAAWQMLAAGVAFVPCAYLHHDFSQIVWAQVSWSCWLATAYLAVFGSVVAYSAYIWLLTVRPSTQVSTYAYVNPVIAVLLGVFWGNEHITLLQITGLLVILGSVLLINVAKAKGQKVV